VAWERSDGSDGSGTGSGSVAPHSNSGSVPGSAPDSFSGRSHGGCVAEKMRILDAVASGGVEVPFQRLSVGGLRPGWHSIGIWVQDREGNAMSLPERRGEGVQCRSRVCEHSVGVQCRMSLTERRGENEHVGALPVRRGENEHVGALPVRRGENEHVGALPVRRGENEHVGALPVRRGENEHVGALPVRRGENEHVGSWGCVRVLFWCVLQGCRLLWPYWLFGLVGGNEHVGCKHFGCKHVGCKHVSMSMLVVSMLT
jgi:hypothetical protein